MVKKASVTEKRKGFTVSASPFNGVKLDLALALIGAALVLLVLERINPAPLWQLAVAASYGTLAALWLLVRVKRIESALGAEQGGERQDRNNGQNQKQ